MALHVMGLVFAAIMLSPAPEAIALVGSRGSDSTHDIATWNLWNFPVEASTVNYMTVLLRDLELDLIAVQEIADVAEFERLISNTNGWDGIHSSESYSLRTGVLYNKNKVTLGEVTELFPDDWYAFPRPPIEMPVTMVESGDTLSFRLIVIHLKAFTEEVDRRRAASDSLKRYVEAQIAATGETKWMIAGDFNDEIDDDDGVNSFNVFLDDSEDWYFLTEPLAGNDYHASFPGYLSLIDHLLVTSDLLYEVDSPIQVETLRLDDEWSGYPDYLSDHRPVAAYFRIGATDAANRRELALPGPMSLTVWPVPSNSGVTIAYSLPPGIRTGWLEVFDITGRSVASLPLTGTAGQLNWSGENLASGIYFLRINPSSTALIRRVVLIR